MGMALADLLVGALGQDRVHTAFVVRAVYQAVGGADGAVMPPTFPVDGADSDPAKRYLRTPRLVDRVQRETVVIDQESSQANRVEEALRDARDAGRLALPMFELLATSSHGEIRLTSLDFPHRYADAYLRDSLVDGVRFDASPVGRRLRTANTTDVRPLFEREPASLVLGAWDSHRKGRWPTFARMYTATMFGLDPLFGVRHGGRLDPINLTGGVDDPSKQESDWKFVPDGASDKGTKLSKIGHASIRSNPVPGGVTVSEVRRIATVSFAGLLRLRFGDASHEAATAARAALAALAIAGDRLAFGPPSVWLRSGCDLNKVSETLGFERGGGGLDEVAVTVAEALEAFAELRGRAADLGVVMADDVITVAPIPELQEAIEFAVAKAADGK